MAEPGKRVIVVSEPHGMSASVLELLRQSGAVTLVEGDRERLLRSVGDAHVLWVRLRHQIDPEMMNAAPNLRVIVTPTTGLDHIALEEARRRDIRIISLRGETEFLENIRATAEHTVALILSLLRRIPAAVPHVLSGRWDRDRFRGRELYGKTAGIVGYGRLGKIVARYLNAFDMRVLAADPYVDSAAVASSVELVALEKLLAEADLVSVHVALTEETVRLFGRTQFTAMKAGAWFVNTARGELVDEAALLEALRTGHLAGAALDVLAGERSNAAVHRPLLAYAREHPNLVITPHLGGCTEESMERTERFVAEKLCAVL